MTRTLLKDWVEGLDETSLLYRHGDKGGRA